MEELIEKLDKRINELHNTPDFALRLEVNNFWLWLQDVKRKYQNPSTIMERIKKPPLVKTKTVSK